jgi:hypothetical protein
MVYKVRRDLVKKVPGTSCRYCGKKTRKRDNPFWPFCSERCKLIDLGKWASEQYRVPGEPVKKEEDEEEK